MRSLITLINKKGIKKTYQHVLHMHQPLRCLRTIHAANSGGQNFRFKVAFNVSRRVLHEKVAVCMDKFVSLLSMTIPFFFFFLYSLFLGLCICPAIFQISH